MRFREFAAKYGQMMHQLNMRMSVALLRDPEAERRAKEKAEAPTVKTELQVKREEEAKEKEKEKEKTKEKTSTGSSSSSSSSSSRQERRKPFQNIWSRKFRPLPEAKAVDLFADVVGDTFILSVAVGLILYEYWRAGQKPDSNKERIAELEKRLDEREEELRAAQEKHQRRFETLELALEALRDPKGKKTVPRPSPPEAQPTA